MSWSGPITEHLELGQENMNRGLGREGLGRKREEGGGKEEEEGKERKRTCKHGHT